MCQVSGVMCYVSGVRCHMSNVICCMSQPTATARDPPPGWFAKTNTSTFYAGNLDHFYAPQPNGSNTPGDLGRLQGDIHPCL